MRVIRVFLETSMSNGHKGLSQIAHQHRIDVRKLPPHEYVVFVNRQKTAFKLFAPGNVVAHYRGARQIDLRTIQHLPQVFNGGRLNYDKAVAKVLERELPTRDVT